MKNSKLAICSILTALLLTGCSSSKPADKEENASVNPEESTEPVKEETEEFTFEEITPVDNEFCSVTIREIDPDSIWGYTLKAVLENKSTDKTYMYSIESATVNGVHCDPLFANEIAPGKKSNEDITLSSSTLKENGITDFTDIELVFRIYDSNDWSADPVFHDAVHIYPQGEDKAVQFVREPASTDQILIDNDQVSVIATGYDPDSIWGYSINLYLVNKTDQNLMYSVDGASINGFMADPFFATTVNASRSEFTSLSWSNSKLEENGITDVEEIEFTLRVYSPDNFGADDLVNEVIKLNP